MIVCLRKILFSDKCHDGTAANPMVTDKCWGSDGFYKYQPIGPPMAKITEM